VVALSSFFFNLGSFSPLKIFEQLLSTSEANKLIRNTYMLLSMTLLFSAIMAGVAMVTGMKHKHWLLVLGGYFS